MSDETLATLVICYLAGSSITLMGMDSPSKERFLYRRLVLWPLYWAYLLVKMAFMLAHERRR
ncbi:hypothetical protein [Pseudomonas sp. UMAB-40]|uniref:hypothetical protein n=1 Tax=Pseudomonas sp. UMAB-40 TaxID=1365407 RepID=UPI001C5A3ED9|nr:hypothetical protein [Pseudomonas sp. UMAB-40]